MLLSFQLVLLSFQLVTRNSCFTISQISMFPSTILSKSPNLFLMELIFRYEKITLLRCECRKRFKVTLIFSSYSGLVVDASIKEAPFTCSTCLVLFHTFFKILIILFAKILLPVLCKCSLSLARQDDFILSLFTNKKFLLLQYGSDYWLLIDAISSFNSRSSRCINPDIMT